MFSVIREILRSLPPEARINGAEFSDLPKTHIPGYIVQDSSAVFLRAGLFGLLVPGHELCLSINALQNKGTFEEMLYRSALKAASLSGMSVGSAGQISEDVSRLRSIRKKPARNRDMQRRQPVSFPGKRRRPARRRICRLHRNPERQVLSFRPVSKLNPLNSWYN